MIRQGRVVSVLYQHAKDKKYYRHDYTTRPTMLLREDGAVEISGSERPAWGRRHGAPWLTNSPTEARPMAKHKRKSSRKRPPPRGFATWRAYMASIRPGSRKHKRRRHAATREEVNPMARRKAKAKTHHKRTRSRRRYHHNPPGGAVVTMVKDGAIAAVGIVAGTAVSRAIPTMAKLNPDGATGIVSRLLSGGVASYLVHRFVSRPFGMAMMAGTVAGELTLQLRKANIPVLSPALGEDVEMLSAYDDGMGASDDDLALARAAEAHLLGMGSYDSGGMGAYDAAVGSASSGMPSSLAGDEGDGYGY